MDLHVAFSHTTSHRLHYWVSSQNTTSLVPLVQPKWLVHTSEGIARLQALCAVLFVLPELKCHTGEFGCMTCSFASDSNLTGKLWCIHWVALQPPESSSGALRCTLSSISSRLFVRAYSTWCLILLACLLGSPLLLDVLITRSPP
jgi:hypothetical protein